MIFLILLSPLTTICLLLKTWNAPEMTQHLITLHHCIQKIQACCPICLWKCFSNQLLLALELSDIARVLLSEFKQQKQEKINERQLAVIFA